VSTYNASTDYAVYLYLILTNVNAGETYKTAWYYENNLYAADSQPNTFNQAYSYLCYYNYIILKGEWSAPL